MAKSVIHRKDHNSLRKDSEEIELDEVLFKYFENNDKKSSQMRGRRNVKGGNA